MLAGSDLKSSSSSQVNSHASTIVKVGTPDAYDLLVKRPLIMRRFFAYIQNFDINTRADVYLLSEKSS